MDKLIYNEFQQTGIDYNDKKKVNNYEKDMPFRDFKQEAINIIQRIGRKEIDILIDFGCGPGFITVEFAKYARHVIGIDISVEMLMQAEARAIEMQLHNISFVHSGFLNYEREENSVDVIITDIALHHLPDFWKQIALYRMHKILKKGGILYLADQMYSFSIPLYQEKLKEWVNFNWKRSQNPTFKHDVETSIIEEYTTFEWIIDGMLERVGFQFQKRKDTEFFTTYLCEK